MLALLPREDGAGTVKIRVSRLTVRHIEWWDQHIQPLIDAVPTRPDAGWDWRMIGLMCSVLGASQAPVGYAVGIERAEEDQFVPITLVQIVRRYPHLGDHRKRAVFLWYLSTAPVKEMVHHGLLSSKEVPKRNGVAGLDVAVTEAIRMGWKGRVGTHADPKGSADLVFWYRKQGMVLLDKTAKLGIGPNVSGGA